MKAAVISAADKPVSGHTEDKWKSLEQRMKVYICIMHIVCVNYFIIDGKYVYVCCPVYTRKIFGTEFNYSGAAETVT